MQLYCCCVTDNSSSQHHHQSVAVWLKRAPQSYETSKRKLFRGFCNQHTYRDRQLDQTSSVMRKTLLCVKYWNVYYIEIFACCRCCYRSDRGPDHLLSYNRHDYNSTIDIFDCQEGPSTKNDNKNYKISPEIAPILDKNFKCPPHDHDFRSLFF